MNIEEYAAALREMDDCIRMSKAQMERYVAATYKNNAMLIKPSLYYSMFTRPWSIVCAPFNRVLRWVGEHVPLVDEDGKPMNDDFIHFTAMLRMAGYITWRDYGWHVVDVQPVSSMDPETFKRYFRSQHRVVEGMPANRAAIVLDALYSEYAERHHIHGVGGYHRFTEKTRRKILAVIDKADPSRSFIQKGGAGSTQIYRANFNIDRNHYLYIEVNQCHDVPEGAPETVVTVSWTKRFDDNDVNKRQTQYDGTFIEWLTGKMDELEPVYAECCKESIDRLLASLDNIPAKR